MTKYIIDKFSRLQGYPAGMIAPEVQELQSAINSMAQYDTALSRALNRAVTNMVRNSGNNEELFVFYDETMDDLIKYNDEYFSSYVEITEKWYEYREQVELGKIDADKPYNKIIKQIERVKNLDI